MKRIPTFEERDGLAPENVKGVAVSAQTGLLYVTTPKRMAALDLKSERLVWNREYEGGCDRMAVAPDSSLLYVPSLKRHGCPSHGIAMTPDESEIWLADAANSRVHVFDATIMPPKQVASIRLRDQPGWVTFSLDGRYAYPSTGDVIDVRTKQIVAGLTDERGRAVQSEKMVDVVYSGGRMTRVGDQFGIGRKR